MKNKNLEQKIGVIDKFRSIARKIVGVYALASALAFGGVSLGGCEGEGDGDYSESSSTGCSYTVGENKVDPGTTYSGCPSGQHCESYTYTTGKNEMGPTKTGYECVSDNPPEPGGGKW